MQGKRQGGKAMESGRGERQGKVAGERGRVNG